LIGAAKRAALLLPLPLLVVGTGLVFIEARGPYWLGTNYDPAYPYLFNSLRLARGEPPVLTEHPGTPVQLIGAVVIRGLHLLDRTSLRLEGYVLRNPEACIRAVVLALLLLHAGAQTLAGSRVLDATRRVGLAWLVLGTPFLSYQFVYQLVDFKPESLLCALSALFVACLATALRDTPPSGPRLAVALGVLAGASVATKYTAVALLAAPLVLLSGLRARALAVGAAVASFLVLTVPALPETSRSLRFLWTLASRDGLYGSGAYSHLYWTRFGALAREEAVFFLVVLASLVAAGVTALWGGRAGLGPSRRAALRVLLALLAVDAVQIALLFKQPYQPRYLLPALGLQGLNLALVVGLSCWDEAGKLRRPVAVAMLAAVLGVGAFQAWRTVGHLELLRRAAACQKQARRAAQVPGCTTVYYPRSSAPAMALKVGDIFVEQAFRETFEAIYPRARFLWEYRKDGRPRWGNRGTLSSEAQCLVFQGSPGGRSHGFEGLSAFDPRDFPVDGRVEVVFNCGWEAVFRVDRTRRARDRVDD
jgi:hypothetical protein